METSFLVLPGIGNAGPKHWQSFWEASNPSFQRVQQRDWDQPDCTAWLAALEEAVCACGTETVLIAHDLGCLLSAHWAGVSRRSIRGALLVAVPDPGAPAFPARATGFSPVPEGRLPFRSVVVASSDDPLASMKYSITRASAWESKLISIGPAGHIDASSGLGEWREGYEILRLLAP